MKKTIVSSMQSIARNAMRAATAAALVVAGMAPMLVQGGASAAPQLPNRELRITTARPSQNFDLTFEFDTTAVTTDVERVELEFCTTPLGTCTATPGTNVPTVPASSTVGQSGWAGATAFGTYTRQAGDNGGTNNQVSISRTDATSEASRTNAQLTFTGFTHTATANQTFYVRLRLYNDASAGTLQWEGVVAQSNSQTLTINARVQEVLAFCVGATTVDDATTSVGAACSNVTGTDVDLGIIDSGSVSITPVSTGNGGDNENAVAMVRTNAVNGVVIDYKTVQETSSGKLKVVGATCSGTSSTDQCFNSSGTTQNSMAAGTEEFGMTIAGINCGSVASYTCTFASGTYNLVRDAEYDGAGTNTYTAGAGNNYAWDDTGTADRIASSAGSSVKVVDDEAMILKFAATSAITTPTGAYTVQADFIATPTF
jgi:hypothetical protein